MKTVLEIEKQAKLIKDQKRKVTEAINKVVAVVTEQNLLHGDNPKYNLEFSTGLSGNMVEFRVYCYGDLVEKVDFWCMARLFESYTYSRDFEIKDFFDTMDKMLSVAKKYAKLNNQPT